MINALVVEIQAIISARRPTLVGSEMAFPEDMSFRLRSTLQVCTPGNSRWAVFSLYDRCTDLVDVNHVVDALTCNNANKTKMIHKQRKNK